MMIFGSGVGLGIHGTLRNTPLVHQLGLLPAPQQVFFFSVKLSQIPGPSFIFSHFLFNLYFFMGNLIDYCLYVKVERQTSSNKSYSGWGESLIMLCTDAIRENASYFAGMVPFAIGSETAGSITYPAARCGLTALRPTFGTVGRTGVMSISESLVIKIIYFVRHISPLLFSKFET